MNVETQAPILKLLRAFEEKDMSEALSCFSDDAQLYDPHYPQPQMAGKEAIQSGLESVFGILKQPGFSVRNLWADENSGAMEVNTHHVFQDGTEAQFPQTFVFEVQDDVITRLKVYVPYPPPAR